MTRSESTAPAAYWFWSHIPTRSEAERQTRELAAAGFGMVMVQTRLSFPREDYLSEAYLRGYRDAVQAAGAAGLQVGVYDEYNWISGHGGGRTVAGADHLRERHLFWCTTTVGQRHATISQITSEWIDGLGPAGVDWVYEDGHRRWDEWELVTAVAHPTGNIELATVVDVTGHGRCNGDAHGCVVTLAPEAPVPDGWVVTAFVAARCASSRLINYLDPRAIPRFIDVCYEPYADACHGLLGDPIRSFQFDHPYGGFYDWRERTGAIGNSLMWHDAATTCPPDAPWSLGQLLLAGIRDVGPDAVPARCALWAAYARRGIERTFAPLAAWAEAHGVQLTGHELLAHVGGWGLDDAFPFLDARTNFGNDYFAVDRHRSETLVDASNFEAQLSPRIGDSIARAHGRGRCTVEQYAARNDLPGHYAAGYWELTLDELRRQALRIHVLGGRRFLFHAYHQTDDADGDAVLVSPRFDFPPAINFEPWFEHVPAFAAESAAVSAFIDGASPIRDVALVYPLHTVWSHGQGHVHAARFGDWARLLAQAGVGYDVVDDRALGEAQVRGGRAWLGEHGYRAVILAGAATLPAPAAVDALERLAAAGGVVLATAPLPGATASQGVDDALATRIAAVCAAPVSDEAPTAVPAALAQAGDEPAIDAGDGPGTLWRWTGREPDDGATRIVLFNDGPEPRPVTIAGDARVLGAGAVVCLRVAPGSTPVLGHGQWDAPIEFGAAIELVEGWTLAVDGAAAIAVDVRRGWEQQGLEAFAGSAVYRCTFDAEPRSGGRWRLTLPEVHCAVRAELNGVSLGARGWAPYRFEIAPGTARERGNELVLTVANSGANRYYAGTPYQAGLQPSGLAAAPILCPITDASERG